jgi:hypothetical protein
MKNILTILLLYFLTFSTFAYSQNPDSLKSKSFNITYSICDYFSLITANAYNINLGSEIYLKNKNSIFFNLGLIKSTMHSGGGLLSISSLSTQGLKIQIERKHYLGKYKLFEPAILLFWPHISQYKSQTLLNSGYYYSIQAAFQQTATKREGENYNQIHNPDDFYTVNRTVYRINLKIGYQCIKKHGLTIDYAIGLGAKYIYSNSRNNLMTNNSWPDNEKDIPWNKLFDTGAVLYPDFVYQLKIGWSF